MNLNIKLRDGFSNSTVSIQINGKVVYRKSGVSTNLAISFATSVDLTVDESIILFKVSVAGGPKKEREIKVNDTPYVEVWILDGKMELKSFAEEMPML